MIVKSVEYVFPLDEGELQLIRDHYGAEPTDEQIRSYLLRLTQEAIEEEMGRQRKLAEGEED